MTTKKATEPDTKDSSPPYDLEYRAKEDDAWYSVSVALDRGTQALLVKYLCYPKVYDVLFPAEEFETEEEAEELARRFRPLSQQVQDHQCRKLAVGTTVCAAHGTAEDDLRFYDAVVEAVDHQAHSFAGGEEECLCTFVLFWLHGRGRGTLTSASIANICTLERFSQVDPRISAFLILVKEKINLSKTTSVLHRFGSESKGPSSDKKNSTISIEKMESSLKGLLEAESSMTSKCLVQKNSWRTSNYERWTSQDEDIGSQRCKADGLVMGKRQHFILINNLEKDLTPSSIKKFIYEKTSILPQAFVFPRQLSDPFARGAIVVDCRKKVQIVYDFLADPNHLIVSSRGRPWVIKEKALTGTLKTTVWNFLPMDLDEIQNKGADEELEVVHSGTDCYNRAKELRNVFIEFMQHEARMCNRLVLEEKKIRRSFNQLR